MWTKAAVSAFLLAAVQAVSAAPLGCTGSRDISMAPDPGLAGGSQSPVKLSAGALTCDLTPGLQAIYVDGVLNSDMTRARGYVQIEWLDGSGNPIAGATWYNHSTKYVETVVDEPLDLARPVQPGAVKVRIRLATQSQTESRYVSGTWKVTGLTASQGVRVNRASAPKIAKTGTATAWTLTTKPDSATGTFSVTWTDSADEHVERTLTVPKTAAGAVNIPFASLPVGHYVVVIKFTPSDGTASGTNRWNFVSLPAAAIAPDPKIGVDSQAGNGFGTTPPEFFTESLDLMKAAGVGTLREHFSSNVFGDCQNWSSTATTNEADVNAQAQQIKNAGFDAVTSFAETAWPGYSSCTQFGADPLVGAKGHYHPLDYDAMYRFGRAYANNIGKNIRAVEYWNEPNAAVFFGGYPWQFVSGLKAFSAGVKSVDKNIRVLNGSVAGNPGQFFYEAHENNVAAHVDVLNYHYYDGNWWKGPYDMQAQQANYINPLLTGGTYDLTQYPSWMTETGFALRRDSRAGSPTRGSLRPWKIMQANHLVKTLAGSLGAGYERAFYFVWSGHIMESDNALWGLTDAEGAVTVNERPAPYPGHLPPYVIPESLSLRPSYLSLALLAQHLQGASAVKVQTRVQPNLDEWGQPGGGTHNVWTVFFQKSGGQYVAVSWAGRAVIAALMGPGVTVRDVFGRTITNPNDIAEYDSAAYLVSGITSLPASNVIDVPKRTRPMMTGPAPLMLQTQRVYVDGTEIRSMADGDNVSNVFVPMAWGQTIEVVTRARDGNNNPVAGAQLECQQTPGMFLLSAPRPAAASGEYTCRYKSQSTAQHDYIAVKASAGANQDAVHIAFSNTASTIDWQDVIKPPCRNWMSYGGSSNISGLSVNVNPSSCAVDIKATVNNLLLNTWYGGYTVPLAGELTSGSQPLYVRVKIVPIPGLPTPPDNAFNFQLLYDDGGVYAGNAWTVVLAREGATDFYSGFLPNATHTRGSGTQYDLAKVDKLMIVPALANLPVSSYGLRIESLQFGRDVYAPASPDALDVDAAITPAATSASITFTNKGAASGNVRWVVLAASAAASSYVDAIDGNSAAVTTPMAAGAGRKATAAAAPLAANTQYTLYLYTKTSGGVYAPVKAYPFKTTILAAPVASTAVPATGTGALALLAAALALMALLMRRRVMAKAK